MSTGKSILGALDFSSSPPPLWVKYQWRLYSLKMALVIISFHHCKCEVRYMFSSSSSQYTLYSGHQKERHPVVNATSPPTRLHVSYSENTDTAIRQTEGGSDVLSLSLAMCHWFSLMRNILTLTTMRDSSTKSHCWCYDLYARRKISLYFLE